MAQSNNIPTNPRFLYRENYTSIGHSPERLTTIPANINGIFMFHGVPNGATDGSFTYSAPTGISQAQENADIQTLKAAGVKLFLTVGGANAQIPIDSQSNADTFVASVQTVNTQLGGTTQNPAFDGIDFNNFETVQDTNQFTYMTDAALQLKTIFGPDFAILAPPAVFGRTVGGQAYTDRQLLATMYYGDGVTQGLDLVFPQCYDGPGNNTQATVETILDFYTTPVDIGGGNIVAIPADHVGVGFGVKPSDGNWWTPANAAAAYTGVVNNGYAPKGAMNFSVNNDPTHTYSTTVVPVITNNVEAGPTYSKFNGIDIATFSANYSALNGHSLTTGARINGIDFPAPAPSYATPALIASTFTNGGGGITTSAINTTGSNFLIIGLACQDSYTGTPTDSAGNTWTELTSYTQGNVRVRLYYVKNATTSATHTITMPSAVVGVAFFAAFSNIETGAFTVPQNGANAFDTSLATGAITPNTDKSLAVVMYGVNGAASPITINNSFTEIGEQDFESGVAYGGMFAYKIVDPAASTSATVTRTNSNGQAVTIASFDAATN